MIDIRTLPSPPKGFKWSYNELGTRADFTTLHLTQWGNFFQRTICKRAFSYGLSFDEEMKKVKRVCKICLAIVEKGEPVNEEFAHFWPLVMTSKSGRALDQKDLARGFTACTQKEGDECHSNVNPCVSLGMPGDQLLGSVYKIFQNHRGVLSAIVQVSGTVPFLTAWLPRYIPKVGEGVVVDGYGKVAHHSLAVDCNTGATPTGNVISVNRKSRICKVALDYYAENPTNTKETLNDSKI